MTVGAGARGQGHTARGTLVCASALARVLRAQERVIGSLPGSRYVPISSGRKAGIVVLKDTTPDEAEDLLQAAALPVPGGGNPDEEEPEPPAPFEFTE